MIVLRRAAEAVAAALFLAMFALMIAGVAARYLFAQPIAWIDEAVALAFLWSIFWTAALVVRPREQVAFDLLDLALPPAGRRAMAVVASLAVGSLFLWALPEVVDYVAFLWRERTPVLQWRLDRVFACFPLFLAAAALMLLARAGRLLGRSWRDHL